MKKRAFGIFTMMSLLLVLTAASVHAQSKRSIINVPFSFTVGQKTLPAGVYTVEPMRRDSDNVWLVQTKKGNSSVLFSTSRVWAGETQEETRLVFSKYDGHYFLAQIWTPGDNSGRALQAPRLERQLAKDGIQRETVVIAGGE